MTVDEAKWQTINKLPGTVEVSISQLPQGVWLVIGSSGWVKKLIKNK
ncbi:MAG: hypothetical protein LBU22_14955 [Dysgonamonadaceae bacterium]|jgi:hypothetical protein|nr:hypothetical protein [Dysgonamonadaceae bacterium]